MARRRTTDMQAREVAAPQARIPHRPQCLSCERGGREQILDAHIEDLIKRPSDEIVSAPCRQQPYRHRVRRDDSTIHSQRQRTVMQEVDELRPRVESNNVGCVVML